ncbi:MAG: hypothetical protein KJ041_09620 [Gammaproteobacteria bacterium]|nr:hypothetical protein [Gammaproteobacteria bacterium]
MALFALVVGLTTAIAERLDDPSAARPIAIAALAVIDLAWREWAFGTEASLRAAIERSFRSLASGSNPIVHHR